MIAHKFGRQYLISNRKLEVESEWNVQNSDDKQLFIHTHPLIECVKSKNADIEVFLIGYILNPRLPKESNKDIVNQLANYTDIQAFIKATYQYGGRYLLIFKQNDSLYVIPDTLAYREAYYYFENNDFYIASQVKLFTKFTSLEARKDEDFLNFISSRSFQTLNIKSFIGDDTHFINVKHLYPNHFIDISHKKTERFFPLENIPRLDIDTVTENCALLLKGLIEAITLRTNITIAFTSGWDSRLTVAASHDVKDRVSYFLNKHPHLNSESPDVWVPSKLAKKTGIDFKILPLESAIEEEFLAIYKASYDYPDESLLLAHFTMAKRGIHAMNVLTLGSEIGRGSKMSRSFYQDNINLSGKKLAKLAYFGNNKYAQLQSEKWLSQLDNNSNINLVDLFFWEQRVGIWGARSGTLADIYRDTFSPFNCRELLINMLGLDAKYRQYNSVLYTKIIKKLWKELMSEPVNPPANNKERLKRLLMDLGIFNILKRMKYT